MRLGLVALGGAVLVGVVVALAAGFGRGSASGCELDTPADQGIAHARTLPAGFRYSSFPPTSGPSAQLPLVWNAYERPVTQFRLVHNLLHGGVAVQWGRDVPPETIARLRAWSRVDPDGTILAPLPELGDRIALTAWASLARCSTFHERAFSQFRARHRFQGPERPPRAELRPGRGGVPNPYGLLVSPAPVRERATVSLVSPQSATVQVEIRAGRASGPLVARLGGFSLFPRVRVRLTWDRRDRLGMRVPAGTYVAVVQDAVRAGQPAAAVVFSIR